MNSHLSPETLLAFSENTLSPTLHAEVAEHLATCALCREEQVVWDALRQRTATHYQGVVAVAFPPTDAWETLQRRLAAPGRVTPLPYPVRWAYVPILLLVLVVLGMTGYGLTRWIADSSLLNGGLFFFGAEPTATIAAAPTILPSITPDATATAEPTASPTATVEPSVPEEPPPSQEPDSGAPSLPIATFIPLMPTLVELSPTPSPVVTLFVTASVAPMPTIVPTLPAPPTVVPIPPTEAPPPLPNPTAPPEPPAPASPLPEPPAPPPDGDGQGDDDDDGDGQGDDDDGDGQGDDDDDDDDDDD